MKKISSTELTVFVYDGSGQLVAEYTAWKTPDPAPVPQVSYLTQDHLGSARIITNQTGQVIKRSDYMAYGDEVINANRAAGNGYDMPSETRKGYTGYERDVESGLDYAQARYYNPQHGRFTSVDPLNASANVKDPQTFNRYTYALNSPYKFTDPLGLIAQSTGAKGSNSSKPPKKKKKQQKAQQTRPNLTPVTLTNVRVRFTDGRVATYRRITIFLDQRTMDALKKLEEAAIERTRREKVLFDIAKKEVVDNIRFVADLNAAVNLAEIAGGEENVDKYLYLAVGVDQGRFFPSTKIGAEIGGSAGWNLGPEVVGSVSTKVEIEAPKSAIDYNQNLRENLDADGTEANEFAKTQAETAGPQFVTIDEQPRGAGITTVDRSIWKRIAKERIDAAVKRTRKEP